MASSSSSSFSSSTLLLALCLVLLACVASAAATKPVPAACLRAATSLCRGAQTDALSCLVTKARDGDAQVPQECSDALKELYPRRVQQHEAQTDRRSRLGQLARLLNEGTCLTSSPQCTGPCITTCPQNCYCSLYVSAELLHCVLMCVCTFCCNYCVLTDSHCATLHNRNCRGLGDCCPCCSAQPTCS